MLVYYVYSTEVAAVFPAGNKWHNERLPDKQMAERKQSPTVYRKAYTDIVFGTSDVFESRHDLFEAANSRVL